MATCHQGIYLVRSLIGVHGLHVCYCPHHIVLMKQAVSSAYLSPKASHFPAPLCDPSLGHGYLAHLHLSAVVELGESVAKHQHGLNVAHDSHKFFLNELES